MAEIPSTRAAVTCSTISALPPAEAAELTAKSMLISAIGETIKRRKLTQMEAARRCGTDQPTLSKVLRGRMESVTIDRLTAWLTALGRTVEIRVARMTPKQKRDTLSPRDEYHQLRPMSRSRSRAAAKNPRDPGAADSCFSLVENQTRRYGR